MNRPEYTTLRQRYYTPEQASKETDWSIEAIRQRVVLFSDDSDYIPLYYEFKQTHRVVFFPAARVEIISEDFRPLIGEMRNVDSDSASYWDITDGRPGTLLSKEATLGPGIFLEIDPTHTSAIAANIFDAVKMHYFRSPPYALGKIPANSVILISSDPPVVSFESCWLSAAHVEAMRSGERKMAPRDKPLDPREHRNLLRIIRALDVMSKLPERGFPLAVQTQLEKLGFLSPKDSAIRAAIEKARALEPDEAL